MLLLPTSRRIAEFRDVDLQVALHPLTSKAATPLRIVSPLAAQHNSSIDFPQCELKTCSTARGLREPRAWGPDTLECSDFCSFR